MDFHLPLKWGIQWTLIVPSSKIAQMLLNNRKCPCRSLLIGVLAFATVASADFTRRVQDVAEPFVWPTNAPAPDDVTMRTLWFRPLPVDCGQDTFDALRQFHATRLDWSYLRTYEPPGRFEVEMGFPPIRDYDLLLVEEMERIREVKDMGRFFSGASNASVGTDVVWHEPRIATKKHTMLGIDGVPLIMGHMRYWDAPQSPGCANNPQYLEGHVQYIIDYINAGAQGMQRDEPSGNESYAARGIGCYCPYCMEGFNEYLYRNHHDELAGVGIHDLKNWSYRDHVRQLGLNKDPDDDYDWSDPSTMRSLLRGDPIAPWFVAFQEKAQTRFFKVVRSRVNEYYGGSFPYSCNNTSFQRYDPELYHGFDFYMSELMMRSANPAHLYDRSQEARRRGKIQVFGSPKTMGEEYDPAFLVRLRRNVIATSYAVGGLCQVPWDLFEQTRDGLGRYFGDPADYADLFAFVRASGEYLRRFDDAGGYGPGIPEEKRYAGPQPVVIPADAGDYYVFVRARPTDYDSPVVVHLVDWNENPQSTVLSLNRELFFPGEELEIVLRSPADYDRELHEGAETKAQALRRDGEQMGFEQRAAYANLVVETVLDYGASGDTVNVEIPAVKPWGMLVIRPR